jgi:hypothetical protein
MARDVDVYHLLRSFSHRNRLTEFEYAAFAGSVQRQARVSDQNEAVYRDLSVNPDTVLIPRLLLLEKEGRLSLSMTGNEIRSVVLPEHYAEIFFRVYRSMDESIEIPFPDEESLKVVVPPQWIQSLSLDTDLASASGRKAAAASPGLASEGLSADSSSLYRIVFPESIRPVVVPRSYVPDKLLEYAVLKIRCYLRQGGNKEFIQNQLRYAFSSREGQLNEVFSAVLSKPYEALAELRSSSNDFTFSFWAYLTSAVKRDLGKRAERTPEDVSVYQATLLCEFYANYYKSRARKVADLELAFKALDKALRMPPFHFSWEDVLALKDSAGQPLLGKYTREELEERLKEKTIKAAANGLPEILIVATGAGRRSYIAKDKLLILAVRLVAEARVDLRTKLINEWRALFEDFKTAEAMSDEAAYRAELSAGVESRFPLLDALLKDRLLALVYDELASKGEAPQELARFFYRGDLVPIDDLLDLPRKSVYADARMLLPLWYSIPILSAIFRLLRRLDRASQDSEKARRVKRDETTKVEKVGPRLPNRREAFSAAAEVAAEQLLPSGYSVDEYLRELEERWNTLLSPAAKRDLRLDVDSLVRDYLRSVTRTMGANSFTVDRIRGLAASLADSPSLLKIQNHAALEKYIQLYMASLLIYK